VRAVAVRLRGALCLAAVLLAAVPGGRANPLYYLYYSFDVPLVLPGISLSEEGTRETYSGTLRGSLGGLPVRQATFTYWTGANREVGGGTFSLSTPAGQTQGGQILMSTSGTRTTLLFFATYLGTHLEFRLSSEGPLLGGAGVVERGLAQTGFGSHEEYLAAVRRAVASLPADVRDAIVAQADSNLRLVAEYQSTSPPRTP
jgi:hypothetical protein